MRFIIINSNHRYVGPTTRPHSFRGQPVWGRIRIPRNYAKWGNPIPTPSNFQQRVSSFQASSFFFARNSKYFKSINLSSLTVSFRPCYLSKIGKFELTMSSSVIKKSEICTRKTQLRKSGKRFGNWKTKRRRRGGGRRRVLLKNRKEKGGRRGIDQEGRGEN